MAIRGARPGGNLLGALWVNFHAQEGGGPGDDQGELLGGVQLQPQGYAKPVPQGAGELPGRVVAPTKVNFGRSRRMELADGPLPTMMSMA